MRALKSKLAAKLLADPAASDQLREFLINKQMSSRGGQQNVSGQFIVKDKKGSVHVSAMIVPKAIKSV